MEPFTILTGAAAPLVENDINTDQIAPAAGHGADTDYGKILFARQRFDKDGNEIGDFVLNRPAYRNARILITGENFGCGSSRESAVWALAGFGIRCIVATGFADIFRENCLKNGVLPVILSAGEHADLRAASEANPGADFTADLVERKLTAPDGRTFEIEISAAERHALLNGLDDIGVTLEHESEIAAWEERMSAARPWLQRCERPAAS